MKFSSLAALEIVKMTTSSAASDDNFIKMTTFPFHWKDACFLQATTAHNDDELIQVTIDYIGVSSWPVLCALRDYLSIIPLIRWPESLSVVPLDYRNGI